MIQVIDILTKQPKYEIRVGPVINDLCFTPDSAYFHVCCGDGIPILFFSFFSFLFHKGNILIYETRTGKFVIKRVEVGALSVTCMAISPNGQYQAVGYV